ncbi:guanine nucleotide-binding protein G(I)/G(S)/G(O) subunit gamma-2 isoform X2 [Hippocampus zosterae]|uniref:guanine nucleotide-binding protein G(I)/G(S)/G(O) subunit gamma-2 isoform X2 n=1 Tax=Hippocampus zosterae TaxID=109293 RepID=UPI00223DDACC|nr:guanine nucleotide-binding protein G(I)/G(S)/G(O) subunit gamma-2 isoform X2 [Hippocampus zosterae]
MLVIAGRERKGEEEEAEVRGGGGGGGIFLQPGWRVETVGAADEERVAGRISARESREEQDSGCKIVSALTGCVLLPRRVDALEKKKDKIKKIKKKILDVSSGFWDCFKCCCQEAADSEHHVSADNDAIEARLKEDEPLKPGNGPSSTR